MFLGIHNPSTYVAVTLVSNHVMYYYKAISMWQRDGKGKAIPVTGRGEPYGSETSRLPHFPCKRLTDCSEVVSLTRWPLFTPQ
jgi:hypothetical protein